MERVNIPRLSIWRSYISTITDEAGFAAIVERLRDRCKTTAPVAVRRQLGLHHKLPVTEIQDLLQAVKDATASPRKADYVPLDDSDTLFPGEAIRRWSRDKTNLKRVIESHTSALEEMQRSQKKCWSYRSKAQKYHVMLHTALAALAYCEPDTAEYRSREAAIRDLECHMIRRRDTFIKYVLEYEGHVLHELTLRSRIHRMAITLENDIRAQACDVIVDHLPAANCSLSLDPAEICRRLYDVTARRYVYTAPPPNVSEAAFNTPVVRSHIEDSEYQIFTSNSTHAPLNPVSVTQPSPEPSTADVDLPTTPDFLTQTEIEPTTRHKTSGWRRFFKFSWGSRKGAAKLVGDS